jgi:hypothetical protein
MGFRLGSTFLPTCPLTKTGKVDSPEIRDSGLRDSIDLEIGELQLYCHWATASLIYLNLLHDQWLKRIRAEGRKT